MENKNFFISKVTMVTLKSTTYTQNLSNPNHDVKVKINSFYFV